MPTEIKTPAHFPRPRVVGRTVRLVLGIFLLFILARIFTQLHGFFAPLPGWTLPGGDWWVAALVCWWALPEVINSGYSKSWRGWPRIAFLTLLIVGIAVDRLVYGSLWALPLGLLILVLIAYVLAHAGISFLVAGVAATPG